MWEARLGPIAGAPSSLKGEGWREGGGRLRCADHVCCPETLREGGPVAPEDAAQGFHETACFLDFGEHGDVEAGGDVLA